MASFLSYKKVILLILNVMLFSAQMCLAAASDPPDFQPQLTIRYFDSQKNREVTLKKCRPGITYQVPAGTVLTLIVDVLNMSDNPCGDPVSTDIWYDWPHQKRPKDSDDADAICIPDDPGDCQQIIENLKTDFFNKGKKAREFTISSFGRTALTPKQRFVRIIIISGLSRLSRNLLYY